MYVAVITPAAELLRVRAVVPNPFLRYLMITISMARLQMILLHAFSTLRFTYWIQLPSASYNYKNGVGRVDVGGYNRLSKIDTCRYSNCLKTIIFPKRWGSINWKSEVSFYGARDWFRGRPVDGTPVCWKEMEKNCNNQLMLSSFCFTSFVYIFIEKIGIVEKEKWWIIVFFFCQLILEKRITKG